MFKTTFCSGLAIIMLSILFYSQTSAQEQTPSENDTSIVNETPADSGLPRPDYGYIGPGGYFYQDSIDIGCAGSFVIGYNLISDKIAYEFQIRPTRFVRFRARRDNHRLMATIFVQSTFLAITMWTGAIIGNPTYTEKHILPIVMAPFGSHLAYRPDYHITIFGGITPDFMLATDDDGMLFQLRTGIRYSIARTGAVLEVEAVKNHFWAWESDSRTFDWGFGVYFYLDPKYVVIGR